MITWHTYPSYIRLTAGTHVPIMLILDLDARALSGAAVANDLAVVEQWLTEFISTQGLPDAVVHDDNPTFPGLTEALAEALTRAGYHCDDPSNISDECLIWAIEHGGRIAKAIGRTNPDTLEDVARALHMQMLQPQPQRP